MFVAVSVALIVGAGIGYASHHPRTVTVDRIQFRDRIQTVERQAEAQVRTVQVAGPVRTVIKRELVQVPGKPAKCEETIVTERGPVTTERAADRESAAQARTETVTRVEIRTVPAPPPKWMAGLRGGLGWAPLAGAELTRCWGPLCLGTWADAFVTPIRPRAAGVSLGVRW